MRNLVKDEIDMAARRESMLEEGFRLFAQKGIDAVSMQEIANACHLGVATLYRYYNTKLALALDIGAWKWEGYASYVREYRKERCADGMTAAEEFGFYLDFFVDLYQNNGDLLRFNQSLNNYARSQKATGEQLAPYVRAIDEMRQLFYGLYNKGIQDGTIRTDVKADKVFATTSHIMLAVVVRYAQGLLYSANNGSDQLEEIDMLKNMIIREYVISS